ncbi:hypothetical protein RIF29_21397 [Crotalaria pallida]|uniref:5'-3' DNA helicase ZGRF1-like N-terminal domain-containing protein n=1 Tax=Crotalaria pallida TaxID=3830 RepID=A0AAN9IDD0_CROPI
MAGSLKRWTVTYTKHLKQKRKVYQDGFLHLHTSTNKVMLYDECEKLLACRVLKEEEEAVKSGGTLEFNGYLVDIGAPEGHNNNNNAQSDFNLETKHNTVSRFKTPCNTKVNGKEKNIAQSRRPLSPSQKIIKEFKKRELLKYSSPKISPETTKPSTTEYQVLYTTQMTQKAKKYHDGFLRLVICGSRGEQVMLLDASRKLLDSRFLKKDDIIRPGESIAFDAYLIDVVEHQGSHIPAVSVQRNNFTNVERIENDKQQTSVDTNTYATVGKSEWQVLYTAQITQKAKKYHDGFLRLEFCGSHGRQVVLYDLSKRPLEHRFLKKGEVIRAGESVHFDGHLVDVVEPEGSHQSPAKLSEREIGNSVIERRKLRQGLNGRIKVNPSVARGEHPSKLCLGQDAGLNSLSTMEEEKSDRIVPPIKPLRDVTSFADLNTLLHYFYTLLISGMCAASQILSFLQDPMPQESYVTACGDSFQFTENVKMSHQPHQDKEAQSNMIQEDTDLSILNPGGHSSCQITIEDESAEEFSCKTDKFPSFDLGF